ncbi:hypothetical protein FRC07_003153, partial [Ceratobasidium sp. 392]
MLDGVQFTRLEHDTLLDRCFKYSTSWLMSVVPHLFLRDMLLALAHPHESTETDHYSPVLHCSLLAFAAAFSDYPAMRQREIRDRLAERAKQLLHDELRRPSLTLIQALAILSEYHSGLGEKERAYMYLGMSIRAVRALKLGRVELRGLSPETLLSVTSEWYFWSIYSQDKITSLELNTDHDLRSTDYEALKLPYVDLDIDHVPWFDSSGLWPPTQPNQGWRLTQVFAESCKLTLIAESIIRL